MKTNSDSIGNRFYNAVFKDTNTKLLTLIILTDFAFILLHFIHFRFDFLNDVKWSLSEERGYSEIFEYIQLAWIAIAFGFYFIKTSSKIYFFWSILFFYLLLDDSLQIHEDVGLYLKNIFHFKDAFNLRSHDFGEMIVYITSGVLFLSAIVFYYRKSNYKARAISNNILFLLASFVLFGFGIDMLGNIIYKVFEITNEASLISIFIEIVEDGGEMFVIGITTWYVLTINPCLDQNELVRQKEQTAD